MRKPSTSEIIAKTTNQIMLLKFPQNTQLDHVTEIFKTANKLMLLKFGGFTKLLYFIQISLSSFEGV